MKETPNNPKQAYNIDECFIESDLPQSLIKAIEQFKIGQIKYSQGNYYEIDMDYDELNACINSAEISKEITENEAWFLRKKYLGIDKL